MIIKGNIFAAPGFWRLEYQLVVNNKPVAIDHFYLKSIGNRLAAINVISPLYLIL